MCVHQESRWEIWGNVRAAQIPVGNALYGGPEMSTVVRTETAGDYR